jgi:mannose-1-phosphate guanylyltransferase/mannose-6-phosphate isomerase
VVLAGGAGERFWPRSRRRFPKPLLRVADGRSLLRATLDRAARFAPRERTWLVCGVEHAAAMRRESGLGPAHVLVEPLRRNTAMAAGFAAQHVVRTRPDAVLVVLPADHLIPDEEAFERAVRRAARAAARAGVLVTLGVKPTRPDTGYGYIQVGEPARGFAGLRQVRRFVEKPDASRARQMLRRGGHLWNAGIFVWSARTLLAELSAHAPEIAAALARLEAKEGRRSRRRPASEEVLAAYRAAPSAPVDVAVLERSDRVWTLPVGFRWSDVGTWASLAEEMGVTESENRQVEGDAMLEGARGNLVWSAGPGPGKGRGGRQVVLLGVEGLAVIDSPDALLVARLDRSQELRRVVEGLRARGREDLL